MMEPPVHGGPHAAHVRRAGCRCSTKSPRNRMVRASGWHGFVRFGEAPDAFYLVVSGILGAYSFSRRTSSAGRQHRAGETVGEMALISGKPRNATVTRCAIQNWVDCRVPAFEQPDDVASAGLAAHHATDGAAAGCVTTPGTRASRIPRTFAVVPNGVECNPSLSLRSWLRISNTLAAPNSSGASAAPSTPANGFTPSSAPNDFVVYVCDTKPNELEQVMSAAGRRRVVARDAARRQSTGPARRQPERRYRAQRTELVLVHKEKIIAGRQRRWLDLRPACHSPRTQHSRYRELSRLLTGHGLGDLFSGGGARGFAHLGVLRAFAKPG